MKKLQVIEFFRKFAGLTQEELAKKIGMNRSTIARLESGHPVLKNTKKLAEILEINPDFFEKSDSPFLSKKVYCAELKSIKDIHSMLIFLKSYSRNLYGIAGIHTSKNRICMLWLKNEKSFFVIYLMSPLNFETYCLIKFSINIPLKPVLSYDLTSIYDTRSISQKTAFSEIEKIFTYLEIYDMAKDIQKLLAFLQDAKISPEKALEILKNCF